MVERHDKSVSPPTDFVQLHAGVPSGSASAPDNTRGLMVGVAGTLNVTMENGTERSGIPFPAGLTPGRFSIVRTSGTASNIWAVV